MTEQSTLSTRRRHGRVVLAGIAACAVGLTGAGLAVHASQESSSAAAVQTLSPQQSYYYGGGHDGPPDLSQSLPSQGQFGQESQAAESPTTDATDAQEVGLVYINTTLDYGTGEAAGTGMILTSDGKILTNHHVVEGATSISVEVVSTGQTYTADVVGYDSTHDVAVLQLQDASGLTPVKTDTANQVTAGDAVTGVGNANGDGGAASASAGTVKAIDQSITVSGENGGAASQLTGLIEVDADIISGDSGGALYDSDGEVIGMNTAASNGSTNVTGYAIPIAQALSIAEQISSGTTSADVQIGNHGYLGVQLSSQVTGALVAGVVNGSAAEAAGVTAGSTITSFNGASVTSAESLSTAVDATSVGDRATVAWTDSTGQAHHETLTLGSGPIG